MKNAVYAFLVVMCACCSVLAQSGSNLGDYGTHFRPAILTGRVTDTVGAAVAGATVSTLSGHSTVTDAAGNYSLRLEAAGIYSIRARGPAGTAETRVSVALAATTTLDLTLRTGLYFPFYQAQGADYAGFAVSNFSDQAAALQFTALGPGGQPLSFPTNPSRITLAARNQIARLGSELFGVDPSVLQSGWVELTSDNPQVSSFFLAGGATDLDGSVALARQSQRFTFTRVYEGPAGYRGGSATTQLSISNPNDHAVSLLLRLQAAQTIERRETIAARGFLRKSIPELFGAGVTASSGYVEVEVTDGDGAAGMEFIRLPDRNTVIGLNASLGSNSAEAFSAQMANGEVAPGAAFFTDLKLINGSAQSRQVTVELIAEDGSALAAPVTVTLAAGAQLERDVGEMFGLGAAASPPARVGSIRVRADGPGVFGDVIFGDPGRLRFAAALPLQTERFTQAVFSQVANALGFFTGLAFFNPGAAAADITIEVYLDTGQLSGSATVPLAPGRRLSRLLTEFVPATAGQVRGYVVVRSTQPIIAQQVFGANDGNFLSAVPPGLAP